MKTCRECKHVVKGFFFLDPDLWKCKTAMITQKISLVTGKPIPSGPEFCSIKRTSPIDPCGPAGVLWESRDE
jgi:hypothetical protein